MAVDAGASLKARGQVGWSKTVYGRLQFGHGAGGFAINSIRSHSNDRPGFPFCFLGAGGRLPKARRWRACYLLFVVQFTIIIVSERIFF